MDNIKRYSSFIKRIATAPEPIRKRLLQSSNLNIIKAICELILNIVQKNISVPKSVIAGLKKNKQAVYQILESKGFEVRKTLLVKNSKVITFLAAIL
jgi:tRNA nucleotidyltransferase (CCA-adding enzyme)